MEINGMAHVILTVRDFDACAAFYGRLLPALGMQPMVERADYRRWGRSVHLGCRNREPPLRAQRGRGNGSKPFSVRRSWNFALMSPSLIECDCLCTKVPCIGSMTLSST